MNWRRTLLTGILAAGLAQASVPLVSTAWADNDHDRDHHWYHEHWTDHDRDHDRWWREHHEGDHDGHVQGDNTRDCGAIHERIRYDHEQAHIIEPTGRHKKALQWYKDDIQNAENDLRTCRR
jgi:hypothetical protein